MTNKTIEVPRELLEKALRDASTIRFSTDSHVVEIRALLAAPVVERQEPAQWQRKSQMHEETWYPLPADEVSEAKRQGWEIRALYTSPPAPVSVVTREQVEIVAESIYWQWAGREGFVPWVKGGNSLKQDEARSIAWSTLDKVKELNQ